MATIDVDRWASASHRNMIESLASPFTGGAVEYELTIGAGGRAGTGQPVREPLVVCGLRAGLGASGLVVEATLDPDGAASELAPLRFAPRTEAGAFLALHRPAPGEAGLVAPFTLRLRASEVGPGGQVLPLADAELGERIELRLIQGVMGRVAYLLGAEKQRLRREGRVLAAARRVDGARDAALDRLGADLGVPRLETDLTVAAGAITTTDRREPDAEYRRRLSIYRPWLMPSRQHIAEALNGAGGNGEPNAGPLGAMGLAQRFTVNERGNELALGIMLVAGEDPGARAAFLAYLRDVHLIWPKLNPPANIAHSSRFLPSAERARQAQLRSGLRSYFELATADANPAFGPGLAASLVLAARCRAALTHPGPPAPWRLRRAQDGSAGSRYELGLGTDLEALPGAELDALAARLEDPARPAAERDVEALLAALQPASAAEDPDGRWLLEPCGLRTVHRLPGGQIFVSQLPFGGLSVSGANVALPGAPAELSARNHAPGDPGDDELLVRALERVRSSWVAGGGAPFTTLGEPAAIALWDAAVPPSAAAAQVFGDARLTATADPAAAVAELKAVPGELVSTVLLSPAQSQAILAGQAGAAAALATLRDLLRDAWIHSVLPLVSAPDKVLLVVGATTLTDAGIRLSRRRVTGVRWYAEPIVGTAGTLQSDGPRAAFAPAGAGLTAIIALGYSRRETTDPYEYEVRLPPEARVSVKQYEFLMNVLEHTHPLGLGVNTGALRAGNVDLDGDGVPDPLSASQSRMYREFRPGHRTGAGTVFTPDIPGLQVGVHSTVGIDTLLKARHPNP